MTCGGGDLLGRHHLLERHHLAAARPGIELPQRLRARSELLLGLHVDPIRAVVELEVVDVLRPEQDLHRARDLVERQSQRQRPLPIDRDLQLRIVGGERAEEAAARTPDWLPALATAWVALRQLPDVLSGLIQHLELEAAEPAQSRNRRRSESDDDGARAG